MRYNRKFGRLELSVPDTRNVISIHGDEFFLENLEHAGTQARGSNSSVFRAQHPDGNEAYVVKFFRHPRESRNLEHQRRLQRFEREIQALTMTRASEYADCVIEIVDDGVFPVTLARDEKGSMRYYVMTEADSDLASFLRTNELSIQQRVFLCSELLRILRGLHAMGIYHRDIKPENVLVIAARPLFGDLGLINFRGQDTDLDNYAERVGPMGFFSPEATNKALGIRHRATFSFDCEIDEKSDIFQLAQLFWLILQDEVPAGLLQAEDVKFAQPALFPEVITPMLQYPKARRADIDAIETAFKPILRELALA